MVFLADLVEFRKLKNLIAVAEEGNITRAAKRLYLSQPALSKEMKGLEEELRVPSFLDIARAFRRRLPGTY